MSGLSALRNEWILYGGLLAAGGIVDVACRIFPAELPVWMPWEFSWIVFLCVSLTLAWYVRGWVRSQPGERPPLWRTVCFVAGVLAIYAVVQTRYDYLSQHLFFFHRFQHLVLHHLGPFLIALGCRGLDGLARHAGLPQTRVRVARRPRDGGLYLSIQRSRPSCLSD